MTGADLAFERKYPSITKWVRSYGWVEFGQLDWYRAATARALDEGGLVWEGKAEYATLDDLLRDLDAGLAGRRTSITDCACWSRRGGRRQRSSVLPS